MPGLYDDSVATLLRGAIEHVWSVTFYDFGGSVIPVDVQTCEVTLDQSWWPYVQGKVTAAIPASQATLDRLDPRRIVRVVVKAGYVLPSGVKDLQQLAVLYLSGRTVRRPDDVLELSLQGQEYVMARAVSIEADAFNPNNSVADSIGIQSTSTVRDVVAWILYEAGHTLFGYGIDGTGWDYANASTATGWSGDLRSVENPPGTFTFYDERYGADTPIAGAVLLDIARDIATLNGIWLRCDETGIWRCGDPPMMYALGFPSSVTQPWGPTAYQFTVGANGTVITSDTSFDRDTEWANLCAVQFSWNADTTKKGRWGIARVTGGPFSVTTVGVVAQTSSESKPYYVTQAVANARAAYLLRRALADGRTIRMDAVAAYWLRPNDTVTIQLPLGPQERHQVSAVTYVLAEGRMQVSTVLPDTASTITLGGG